MGKRRKSTCATGLGWKGGPSMGAECVSSCCQAPWSIGEQFSLLQKEICPTSESAIAPGSWLGDYWIFCLPMWVFTAVIVYDQEVLEIALGSQCWDLPVHLSRKKNDDMRTAVWQLHFNTNKTSLKVWNKCYYPLAANCSSCFVISWALCRRVMSQETGTASWEPASVLSSQRKRPCLKAPGSSALCSLGCSLLSGWCCPALTAVQTH